MTTAPARTAPRSTGTSEAPGRGTPPTLARRPLAERPLARRTLLALLWVAVTAYNLAKPFHIDDTAHLEIARWIMAHPLHPMSGMLNWSGVDRPIHDTNQPHLYFYLLAGWASVFGFSEIALHAFQSLFALACVVLFHRLARHFCPGAALWTTAMLILGPAFVVEQNLMVDVPLLACWLLFFDAILLRRAGRSPTTRYLLAALACSAAELVKYSSLTLLPVLVVSLVLERRWRQAWTTLVPVATLVAWSAFNVWDYGGIHVLTRQRTTGPVGQPEVVHLLTAAATWAVVVGAITPLGVLAAAQDRPWLRRHERAFYGLTLVGPLLLVVAVATGRMADTTSDRLLPLLFAGNSALLLICFLPKLVRRGGRILRDRRLLRAGPDVTILILWFVGGSAFYVLFAPFVATRHVLIVLPALLLLFGRRYGDRLSRGAKVFALGLTLVLSAGLCLGDWQFAAFYRSAAPEVASTLPATGQRWTSGHWGWQWYAEQNGMTQVDRTRVDLRPGDSLVVADDALGLEGLEHRHHLVLVGRVTQQDPLLSLFCTARRARFYATDLTGPWSLSRSCVGHLSIYRVTG